MVEAECSHAADLLELIGGKWTTQAVGAAAELGIADVLAGGTRDVIQLARATRCDAASLGRLLRALATIGIVSERGGEYELTARGALLRSDASRSLRAWATWTARHQWQPWGQLAESVRSGKPARNTADTSGYGYGERDDGAAELFNRAMADLTRLTTDALLRACDFSAVRVVADIGGGCGELLALVLAEHRHLRGVLFDLPRMLDDARARFAAAELATRCDFVGGSFFEGVPEGCDLYVLKSILHNWDDGHCAILLGHCRRALTEHARLLIIERIMPERITGATSEKPVVRSDLNMLVGLGGRERTLAQLEVLLESAGLAARRSTPLAFGFALVEAASA
jgi:hypothetical protein